MVRLFLAIVLSASTLVSAGCFNLFDWNTTTQPSAATGVETLGGTWTSVSSATQLSDICTGFTWHVTEIAGDMASGTFSATCQGGLQVAGAASGAVSGSAVAWNATATATAPETPDCAITLSGTATLESSQIRIPYSGSTCMGPVNGTEILRKGRP